MDSWVCVGSMQTHSYSLSGDAMPISITTNLVLQRCRSLPLALGLASSVLSNGAHAHSGVPNTLPWQACESSRLGSACSYSTDTARYSGSCQAISGSLMCVRQNPIEYLSTHQHEAH